MVYVEHCALGYSAASHQLYQHICCRMFQISGDLEDLEVALKKPSDLRKHVLGSGSCSALIKLLPENADVYIAHDTWNSYQSMLRILKRYEFNYHLLDGAES